MELLGRNTCVVSIYRYSRSRFNDFDDCGTPLPSQLELLGAVRETFWVVESTQSIRLDGALGFPTKIESLGESNRGSQLESGGEHQRI